MAEIENAQNLCCLSLNHKIHQHIRKKWDTRLKEIDTFRSHAHHIIWLDNMNQWQEQLALWDKKKENLMCLPS